MAVELAAIADARRSKETGNDYGVAEAHLGDADVPESVDLRRPWHAIADQGETASCVGWAVADSVVRWHLVEGGRLAPDELLSARYVWMSAKETDQRDDYPSTFLEQDGTALKSGLDVVRKFGVALVLVETGVSGPRFAWADVAHRFARVDGRLALVPSGP